MNWICLPVTSNKLWKISINNLLSLPELVNVTNLGMPCPRFTTKLQLNPEVKLITHLSDSHLNIFEVLILVTIFDSNTIGIKIQTKF